MSCRAMTWAIAQQTGDSTSKLALMCLAYHHNGETGLCCPSIRTLSEEMNASLNTVRTALRKLQSRGFIDTKVEKRGNAVSRTLYVPLMGDSNIEPSNPEASTFEGGVVQNLKEGGSNLEGGVVQDLHLKGNIEKEDKGKTEKEYRRTSASDVPEVLVEADEADLADLPPDFFPNDQKDFASSVAVDQASDAASASAGTTPKNVPAAEVEKPKARRKAATCAVVRPEDVDEDLWDEWCHFRKAKRASVSERVIRHFRSEATEAGMSLPAVLELCLVRGWQGFEAEWLKDKRTGKTPVKPISQRTAADYNDFLF